MGQIGLQNWALALPAVFGNGGGTDNIKVTLHMPLVLCADISFVWVVNEIPILYVSKRQNNTCKLQYCMEGYGERALPLMECCALQEATIIMILFFIMNYEQHEQY